MNEVNNYNYNLKLFEASALTGDATELPDQIDNALLNEPVTSDSWDELYKKYSQTSKAKLDYYSIFATNIKSKSSKYNLGSSSGFIRYNSTEETGKGTTRFLKKERDTITDPKALTLTQDKKNASLFTREDAEVFIKALEKDPDLSLRLNKFSLQKENVEQKDIGNYLSLIIKKFWMKLTNSSNTRFIDNCLSYLVTDCSKRLNSPLNNNSVIQILGKLSESERANYFNFTAEKVINLKNILARDIVSIADAKNPEGVFSACLLYNPKTYELKNKDFEEIVRIYWEIIRLSSETFTNLIPKNIGKANKDTKKNFAKKAILNIWEPEEDPYTKWLSNNQISEEDKEKLMIPLPSKPSGELVKSSYRSLTFIKQILEKLKESEPKDEDDTVDKKYILQVITKEGIKSYIGEDTLDKEDNVVDIEFDDIDIPKNSLLRLIKAIQGDSKSLKKYNILVASKDNVKYNKKFLQHFEFDKEKGFIAKKDFETGLRISVEIKNDKTYPVEIEFVNTQELLNINSEEESENAPNDTNKETEPDKTEVDKATALPGKKPQTAAFNTITNAIATADKLKFDSAYNSLTDDEKSWIKTYFKGLNPDWIKK